MFQVIQSKHIDDVVPFTLLDMNAQFYTDHEEFKTDINVIMQAFLVLLSVPKGSRWWRPEYGTVRLYDLLFEPYDQTTADSIANVIQITGDSYYNGNNRLTITEVLVQLTQNEAYLVTLTVSVPGFDDTPIQFGLKKMT